MVAINGLIQLLSQQERAAFIQHLKKRNKRNDTKNIQLFKAFVKGDTTQIKEELGGNAYNVLKKRLSDRLIDFIASNTLSNELSTEAKIIQTLLVARKLFNHQVYDVGFKLLLKAERKAKEIMHYSLLNELYTSMIEYSHFFTSLDQEELFAKLEGNNADFMTQQRLNLLYTSMKKQFKNPHSIKDNSFEEIYNTSRKKFGVSDGLVYNFQSLAQLCAIADLYCAQSHNYQLVDLFFEDKISQLTGSEADNEKMLPYHIEVLYNMANIYFRKKDFAKSMCYLRKMDTQLARSNKKYEKQWMGRQAVLKALNLNFTKDSDKASDLLEKVIAEEGLEEKERVLVDLTLCLVYFQHNKIDDVKRIMTGFDRSDTWYLKNIGSEWLFNQKAMEILLHFDLGNDLLVESKLLSFQRKYADYFKSNQESPIWPFLGLIKQLLQDPSLVHTEGFVKKVERVIPWKEKHQEDLFFICYYAWLKAKMNRSNLYITTMEIIEGSLE